MLTEISYDRERVVAYARQWALSRNPLFADFTGGGGNCTNFVSQCMLAGCSVMDLTPTFGWYYRSINDRAPAWSGVDELYGFLTGSGGFETERGDVGPYATVARSMRQVEVGDVVQLANSAGEFYHTLIISEITPNDILICAHSDDALDRPLSSYNYASLRILHIMGAFIDLPSETAYENLLTGNAIETVVATAVNVRG